MTRQQTLLLLSLGGLTVAGGVAWYLYAKSSSRRQATWFDPSRASTLLQEQPRFAAGQIYRMGAQA